METIATILLTISIVVGFILGIFWLFWELWCFVLPQIWSDGPHNFILPSYWLFVGMWTLASFLGKAIFGRSESKDEK